MKKYQIIYSDPPWSYTDKMHAGERGADYKYKTMSLEDIKALPVEHVTDENCALFMWVTMPFIFEAKEVMKSWGFTYKTCAFNWIKINPKATKVMKELNKLFEEKDVDLLMLLPYLDRLCKIGNGSYSRANGEICLLGLKGKMKRLDAGVRQVILAPIAEHSRKPPETRDRIIQLFGDLPRLEMFATQEISGWDSLGNKLDGKDLKDSLLEV